MDWKVVPIERWPGPMTGERRQHPFRKQSDQWRGTVQGVDWDATMSLLDHELWQLDAENVVLQMAVERRHIRKDGWIKATASPEHPGIILSFDSKRTDRSPTLATPSRSGGGTSGRSPRASRTSVDSIATASPRRASSTPAGYRSRRRRPRRVRSRYWLVFQGSRLRTCSPIRKPRTARQRSARIRTMGGPTRSSRWSLTLQGSWGRCDMNRRGASE